MKSGTDMLAEEIAEKIGEVFRRDRPIKELYTVPEAAEVLGCCENTVRELAASGRLPKVMLDKRPRFRRRDIDRLIERSTE